MKKLHLKKYMYKDNEYLLTLSMYQTCPDSSQNYFIVELADSKAEIIVDKSAFYHTAIRHFTRRVNHYKKRGWVISETEIGLPRSEKVVLPAVYVVIDIMERL